MIVAPLSLSLLLTVSPVEVKAAACPSGPEVEAALTSMLPPLPPGGRPDVAHVSRREGQLVVELVDADGALVGERRFDDSDRCVELATWVAVVLASWESDVHPEFSRAPEPLPLPARADGVATPLAPSPTPPTPTAGPGSSFDVAVGASLSYATSLAAGGAMALTWIPRGQGLGLHFSVATESAHTLDLGSGRSVRWRRYAGNTEGDVRLAKGPGVLDLHAGLTWDLLMADSSGFTFDTSDSSFAPGFAAGARVSWWATPHVAVWLDLAGSWRLRARIMTVSQATEQEIPRFAIMATLGLALGRAPRQR